MFNPFEKFNMTPKNDGPKNPITKSEDPPVENKPAEPTLDQAQDVSKFESPTSPETEASSTPIEKNSPNSGKLVGTLDLKKLTIKTLGEESAPVKTNKSTRSSAIFKVAGVLNEEMEKNLLENSRRTFETQPINKSTVEKKLFSTKTFKDIERPITPEETETVRIVNQNMAEFIRQYGGEPLSIGVEQVHFVDDKKINEGIAKELDLDKSFGYYSGYYQSIVVSPYMGINKLNLLTLKLKRAQGLTHEFMHFNSFQSDQYDPNSPNKRSYRRCGIKMSGSGDDSYFQNLNEAITEELAMRFGKMYFNQIPSIQKDLGIIKKEELSLKENFDEAQKTSVSYSAFPDIGFIAEDGEPYKHSYPNERKHLGELIRIIFQRNPGKFQSEEEVFGVFARAYFTGKTLELARLIEKTYPVKGAFRRIGEEK